MIELAPHHKIGLPLARLVMIASGCCGYGQAYQGLLDLSGFGAVVTGPITLRPQRGVPQPRLAETKAGFILNTGQQNPGVKKVIREYGKSWPRLGLPVIAHLPVDEPEALMRTARALSGQPGLAAFELGVPASATPDDVEHWLRALQEGADLPLLVKLPLGAAPDIIEAAIEAADALVIATPPLGTALSAAKQPVTGYLYGPALHSLVLYELQRLAAGVDLPLIAVGGIHTLADAQAFLAAGASAVQLDSLLFIDPKLAGVIAQAISNAP